jgi:nitroreductase
VSVRETESALPEIVESILTRASAITLKDPGPTPDDLRLILRAGTRAPDHGKLQPWRFVVIEGAARERLGAALAERLAASKADVSEIELQRERAKPLRSPTIVTVGAKVVEGGRIPAIEQITATAAAVQNMILAAHALGYGTMWKTGPGVYDDAVKAFMGFEPSDVVVGMVYIGTMDAMPRHHRETKLDELISHL